MSIDPTVQAPGARLRAALSVGRPLVGSWVTSNSPETVTTLETTGVDYIGFDCQHGVISDAAVADLLRSPSEKSRLVRVSANKADVIGKVLDCGADGVIVPMVNNAAEAAQAANACRYPPAGNRSYGPIATRLSRNPKDLDAPLCLAMIETADGVKNAAEILSVPGIDGFYIGPADLGLALGLGHAQFPPTPTLLDVLEPLLRLADKVGAVKGVHAGSGAIGGQYAELGFQFLTLRADVQLVRRGVEADLDEYRSATGNLVLESLGAASGPY